MKVVIVNCFDTYEERLGLIFDFFKRENHKVIVLESNFSHLKKKYRNEEKEEYVYIETKPYYKNLSFDRLRSHYKYSKLVMKKIEELNPDLVYSFIPPNSLTKFLGEYKRKNLGVKLIFDLMDFWPETMPIGKMKEFFPFSLWRDMRNKNLKYSNIIITECDLYKKILKKYLINIKAETLYLAKKNIKVVRSFNLSKNKINLCYLGSINNIIDIDFIKKVVKNILKYKPVILHIIGDGEKKAEFIEKINLTGAKVKYYGKIYDAQEKQKIFDECHFGFNIMKKTVCVGLTMKSIDYFQYGLPLINNIPEDTFKLVEKYKVGYNISNENMEQIIKKIINNSLSESLILKENSINLFKEKFCVKKFEKNLKDIIEKI